MKTRRDCPIQWKVDVMTKWCLLVLSLDQRVEPEYVPETQFTTTDSQLDAAMDDDSQLREGTQGPGTPGSQACDTPQSPSADSPSATAASQSAAAASSTHRTRSVGRPAVKAAEGKKAQEVAREASRLGHARKSEQATELLGEHLLKEGAEVAKLSSPRAQRLAKELSKELFENASLSQYALPQTVPHS